MKKNNIDFPVRLVVSYKEEAISICEMFNLQLLDNTNPFKVFCDQKKLIWLIISGPGKNNSFRATNYLSKISFPPPWSLWMNFGIAGHINEKIGNLVIVDKVINGTDKKYFFTGSVAKLDFPKSPLISLDKPIKYFYKHDRSLYDMEAAGFMRAVEKFTFRELICIIKIVSDNSKYPFNKNIVNIAKKIIRDNKINIKACILAHKLICKTEKNRFNKIKFIKEILESFHFTHSEKLLMKRNLTKWNICYPNSNPEEILKAAKSAKEFINILDNQIFETIK